MQVTKEILSDNFIIWEIHRVVSHKIRVRNVKVWGGVGHKISRVGWVMQGWGGSCRGGMG